MNAMMVSGYKGRIAIAECIEIDQTIKEMIHDQSSEGEMFLSYVFDKNPSIDSFFLL